MEEIKFRAWDTENKEMIYFTLDELYDSLIDTGCVNSYPTKERLRRLMRIVEYDRSENVRMLYTGLKDKNGLTYIYEYDIIDKDGIVRGNYYENKDLLEDKTNFLIQGFGTATWEATNKEAMVRGCKYSE